MPLFCPLQECSIVKLQSVSSTIDCDRVWLQNFADTYTSNLRLLLIRVLHFLQLLRSVSCAVS